MKFNINHKWKKLFYIAILYAFLDKAVLPFASNLAWYRGNYIINTVESTRAYNYKYDYDGDNQTSALKYLKLAHAISLKYFNVCELAGMNYFNNLESMIGDCSDISTATYSGYIFLINNSKKEDLAKYVRIAMGELSDVTGSSAHQWIEINLNGNWKPYETCGFDLPSDINLNPKNIDELITEDKIFFYDRVYSRKGFCQLDTQGHETRGFDWIETIREGGPGSMFVDWCRTRVLKK